MATLSNNFNNCFLNVILQLLTISDQIVDTFDKEKFKSFFQSYKSLNCVNVTQFLVYYKTLHKEMTLGRQQDSVDTLTYLLDESSNKTPFGIEIKQNVYNKSIKDDMEIIEKSESSIKENFLSVPIKETMSECLEEFFKEVEEDSYEVTVDGKTVKRFTPRIEYQPTNQPDYLFVSVKRFDPYTLRKNNTKIENTSNITYNHQNYSIVGFVIHIGSTEGGHYYMVKIVNKKWYIYDDTNCREIDETRWRELQQLAYIYLYIKDELFYNLELTKEEESIDEVEEETDEVIVERQDNPFIIERTEEEKEELAKLFASLGCSIFSSNQENLFGECKINSHLFIPTAENYGETVVIEKDDEMEIENEEERERIRRIIEFNEERMKMDFDFDSLM